MKSNLDKYQNITTCLLIFPVSVAPILVAVLYYVLSFPNFGQLHIAFGWTRNTLPLSFLCIEL